MRCSKCGSDNRETARFCDKCGTQFPPRCSSCGALNRSDARFCDSCGAALAASRMQLAACELATPAGIQVSPESGTPDKLVACNN
jgi:uncharacterized membrane protein YvbJ